jgi:sterol carrier protein 2
MHTDGPVTFESGSAMEIVGFDMSRRAAEDAFTQAGEGSNRDNVGVVELHGRCRSPCMRIASLPLLDCFAANEVRSIVSRCPCRRT